MVNIGFLPQVGGSYRSLYQFARYFPPESLTIFTSHVKGEKTFDQKAGLSIRRSMVLTASDLNGEVPWLGYAPLYRNWLGRRIFALNPLFYPLMAAQFAWVVHNMRKRKYDLFWGGQAIPTGWMGWGLKKVLGVPYCLFIYGEDVTYYIGRRTTPGKRMFLSSLREADLLVANSESTRREARKLCEQEGISIDAGSIPVITPGVDTDLFGPSPRDDSSPGERDSESGRTLITVSRLTRQKGVDRMIRILPEILREFPDTRYLIRGDGPHRPALEKMIREERLDRQVRFLDPVPYDRLPALYRRGDIFVLPGREDPDTGQKEGFGMVFLEASACGLPAIGGRTGGVSEAVADGETGYLVDPADDAGLKNRILNLLRNPQLAEKMGREGRYRAVKEFGWEARSKELWKFMEAILEKNHHLRKKRSMVT